MISVLKQLQILHGLGYVYRNIKTASLGYKTNTSAMMFLSMMTMSERFVNERGEHLPEIRRTVFIGSPGYASLRTHNCLSPSRKDDLESCFYLLWMLLYGEFP